MDKKSVSSESGLNQEQVSFDHDFKLIESGLYRLNFIREVYRNFEDGYEDVWSEMLENVLPGIIRNLEEGFSAIQEKLSQPATIRPQSAENNV